MLSGSAPRLFLPVSVVNRKPESMSNLIVRQTIAKQRKARLESSPESSSMIIGARGGQNQSPYVKGGVATGAHVFCPPLGI